MGWCPWRTAVVTQEPLRRVGFSRVAARDVSDIVSKLRFVQWDGNHGGRVFPGVYRGDIPVVTGIFRLCPGDAQAKNTALARKT